jgi:hypothetical protein
MFYENDLARNDLVSVAVFTDALQLKVLNWVELDLNVIRDTK